MLSNISEENSRLNIINETFNHSAIPMFWCSSKSFIIFNKAFLSLTEYTDKELLSKHFNELSNDQIAQLKLEELFFTNEREFKITTWVIANASGKTISLELRITQLIVNGEYYYYGVVRNLSSLTPQVPVFIEDKKRLEIALKASKQGLWDWNVGANETFYDKEYYSLLGYDVNDFSPNYEIWLDMLHPDDVDRAVTIWEDFVSSGKNEYQDEFRLKKKDGSYIWVTSKGLTIDKNKENKPVRVIGVVQNINDKKLDELKIQVQTQKLIDYTFFNSHRLRAPLSTIMGLAELLKHEYSTEIVENLEQVSHQLDNVIHEINQILVGENLNYKNYQNNPIKKISLIDNDKLLHVVYKKTIERYTNNIEITAYERAKQVLELLENKTLNTDLILLDIDSAFDIWGFLDEFDKTEVQTSIYILAKNIAITDTIKVAHYNCVKGILLKPLDRKTFTTLIAQMSN